MTIKIKFRAWDKKTKSIISEVFELGLGDRHNPETWLVGDDRQTDSFELMLFTGLRDADGKELYEGDIVSIEHIYYQGVAQYDSRLKEGFRKIGNYVLKYDEGRFVFSNGYNSLEIHNFWRWNQEKQFYYATGDFVRENDRYGHFSKEYFRFLKLKGNVFENPEFLESNND